MLQERKNTCKKRLKVKKTSNSRKKGNLDLKLFKYIPLGSKTAYKSEKRTESVKKEPMSIKSDISQFADSDEDEPPPPIVTMLEEEPERCSHTYLAGNDLDEPELTVYERSYSSRPKEDSSGVNEGWQGLYIHNYLRHGIGISYNPIPTPALAQPEEETPDLVREMDKKLDYILDL